MKCPKCNKEMVITSSIIFAPQLKITPSYWACSDKKKCKYEMPREKKN